MKVNFKSTPWRVVLILLIALVILTGISFLPLSKWTGGTVKDFNLLADIMNLSDTTECDSTVARDGIDPELAKLYEAGGAVPMDSSMMNNAAGLSTSHGAYNDTVAPFIDRDTVVQPVKNNKVGGIIAIEDYTTGNIGLLRFKAALKSGRLARVAVVGDSYIEGDILTQDLRASMQDAYGGEGVGYVNMQTEFPGFRRTVKQGGSGWKGYAANKKGGNDAYYGLSEQYFIPTGQATSTYAGVTANHLSSWSRSRFLFISPNDATVSVRTSNSEWIDHQVKGSDAVQSIHVTENTTEFDVRTSDTRLIGLGVWLDGTKGVSVDNMSSRGFSGVTLTNISSGLCRAMARDVNYDLIILEFGINAMSANQTNYKVYSNKMVEVINHVRTCYPNADILVMGIGDRGQRKGGAVHSMAAAPYMVSAQRDAARRAHCLFWDTREAMGGEDAVVKWSQQKLVNTDYIHLTHQGGAKLAELLFKAIRQQLN